VKRGRWSQESNKKRVFVVKTPTHQLWGRYKFDEKPQWTKSKKKTPGGKKIVGEKTGILLVSWRGRVFRQRGQRVRRKMTASRWKLKKRGGNWGLYLRKKIREVDLPAVLVFIRTPMRELRGKMKRIRPKGGWGEFMNEKGGLGTYKRGRLGLTILAPASTRA